MGSSQIPKGQYKLGIIDTDDTDFFDLSGNNALFDTNRTMRWLLWREWDDSKPKVLFIGLNPSTASEDKNDPTMRRIIGFAKSFGYGGVIMGNLFPHIATDPKDLCPSIGEGVTNDALLQYASNHCDKVVFAWGSNPKAKLRCNTIYHKFKGAYCLGKTKGGDPRHPLYLKSTTKLELFF